MTDSDDLAWRPWVLGDFMAFLISGCMILLWFMIDVEYLSKLFQYSSQAGWTGPLIFLAVVLISLGSVFTARAARLAMWRIEMDEKSKGPWRFMAMVNLTATAGCVVTAQILLMLGPAAVQLVENAAIIP